MGISRLILSCGQNPASKTIKKLIRLEWMLTEPRSSIRNNKMLLNNVIMPLHLKINSTIFPHYAKVKQNEKKRMNNINITHSSR